MTKCYSMRYITDKTFIIVFIFFFIYFSHYALKLSLSPCINVITVIPRFTKRRNRNNVTWISYCSYNKEVRFNKEFKKVIKGPSNTFFFGKCIKKNYAILLKLNVANILFFFNFCEQKIRSTWASQILSFKVSIVFGLSA